MDFFLLRSLIDSEFNLLSRVATTGVAMKMQNED